MAFDGFFADGPAINAAVFLTGIFNFAIIDLNLVAAHHIDAGVGMLRYPEFDVGFDIAEFGLTDEIDGFAFFPVGEDAIAGSEHEFFGVGCIQSDGFRGHPSAGGFAPTGEIFAVEKFGGVGGSVNETGDDKKIAKYVTGHGFKNLNLYESHLN